jgi:hypothetical protein
MSQSNYTAAQIRESANRIAFHELLTELREKTAKVLLGAVSFRFGDYGDWVEYDVLDAERNVIELDDDFQIAHEDYIDLLRQVAFVRDRGQ